MKHAKRMVLVPEDALHRYEQRQRLETSPIMANMMHADTDMAKILQRTAMDDAEKQKLYYANLERYLDLRRQKDSQIPTVRIAPGSKEESKERVQLSDASIVEPIPKSIRPRATALLNRLKERPDVISWDESGQVKLKGETIPQSNISDLVSDAVRARKNFNPRGSTEFFQALSKINVPKDLARNEERWKEVLATSSSSFVNEEEDTPIRSYFRAQIRKQKAKEEKKKKTPEHPQWIDY